MLNYHLQKEKGKALYQNLYECLKQDILAGRIEAGSRIPSKREMAESHGISVRTVMNAYDQLLAEGYLISREKRGYFVAKIYEKNERIQKVLPQKGEDGENLLVNFSSNHLIYERFPFSMWKKVMREVLAEYETELIERADCCGVMRLREAIAAYLGRARGMEVSAENIIIGSGVESLYGRLFKILPQDAIYAAETPGYRKIPWIYEDLHLNWCSVGMDEEGISMGELRKSGASVIHASPEHHYPLGIAMTEKRKQELLEQNEMEGGKMFKIRDDPRITRVGHFIRKYSIDEFPQFVNVLKGDMSLVGTRPPTPDEFHQYDSYHKRRLSMKPGITGMWQVSGRSEIRDFEEVVRLDCEYIDNWSLSLDMKILLKTVVQVFRHKGAQ